MNSMDHSQVKILSITADGTPRTDGFIGGYIEGYDYRYYKTENGLRVPATQDEANAVRESYKSFVEYGSQAELNYLKCTLALPYEPLNKEAFSLVEANTVWSTGADIIGALRLTVTALDDSSVSFVLSSFDFDAAEYAPVITATAEKNGDCYTFDTDEASGTVELGISGVWLDVIHLQNSDDMDVGLQFFCTLVEERTP
ncbi:MAG: hypothetical protein IKM08_02045 [Clostridia bacterium]|nr:hypothetical protein [Clostridia bacterium]